jgi:hypothetical protein
MMKALVTLMLFAESLFYQHTTVEKLALGQVHMTRAEVTGKVTLVKKEADGDMHIRVSDGKHFIVAECMPQMPCVRPKVGQAVTVQGITRFDGEHKWFELHPVTKLTIQK